MNLLKGLLLQAAFVVRNVRILVFEQVSSYSQNFANSPFPYFDDSNLFGNLDFFFYFMNIKVESYNYRKKHDPNHLSISEIYNFVIN